MYIDQNLNTPTVSIGMPVYNGEKVISKTLDSLLSQSFRNFELIISDNASSDGTEEICRKYAAQDSRIRYIRQDTNLGSQPNFKYVLEKAVGKYFMWNGADDLRTPDFIECNLEYLELNPTCVASTSPNCFEDNEDIPEKFVTFSIEGSLYERLNSFLDNCRISNGIYLSLVRISVLRDCEFLGRTFIAADWSINVHMLTRGSIKRVSDGLLIMGKNGISNSRDPYGQFRTRKIEYIFPLYEFSIRFAKTVFNADEMSFKEKAYLLTKLAVLNIQTAYRQICTPYIELKRYIRPWYIKYLSK